MLLAPLFLYLGVAADKYIEDADRFPGWKGELPHMKHGQPGEPDSVELAFGEHGKVSLLPTAAPHVVLFFEKALQPASNPHGLHVCSCIQCATFMFALYKIAICHYRTSGQARL